MLRTKLRPMTNLVAFALVASLAVATPVLAQTGAPISSTDKETDTVTAVVTAINPATRMVTAKLSDGRVLDIKAGDEVRNFAQIKVGDELVATLQLSLTYTVFPIGTKAPTAMVVDQAARAKPGAKPAGAIAQSTTLTAIIVGVDVAAKTVTIVPQGGGPLHTLQVQNPERQALLPKVKPGQLLAVTYTEALAVEVVSKPK